MKAITISVDFADILALSLSRNAPFFERVLVVTSPQDDATAQVAAQFPNVSILRTDAFYRGEGAVLRKWLALEEGLDLLGREGWLCVFDADVLLPRDADFTEIHPGYLYSAWRRMLRDPAQWRHHDAIDWQTLPQAPDQEHAGYLHVFHARDRVLGEPPWYGVEWSSAAGGDSSFCKKWPMRRKLRFPWEVLHLGDDGVNWCGRVTPRADGTIPPDAAARAEQLQKLLAERERTGRHDHEKIRGTD